MPEEDPRPFQENVSGPSGCLMSSHRLGPRDMPFKAKRFGHGAIAIAVVAIGASSPLAHASTDPAATDPRSANAA
jgi:hypothetical protein